MEQSILKSTKKVLQIGPTDESFDLDIVTHINSAFSTLTDLGVGPDEGFAIVDASAVWADFIAVDVTQLNRIKLFVLLHSRLLFDPPATTFHLNAVQSQLDQLTWRINVHRETTEWVDPNADGLSEEDIYRDLIVLDGGDATP